MLSQVDGTNLQGFTNQQAVEVLRHTGQTVRLTLMRKGASQEAEITSREDTAKDVDLPAGRDLCVILTLSSNPKAIFVEKCFDIGWNYGSVHLL